MHKNEERRPSFRCAFGYTATSATKVTVEHIVDCHNKSHVAWRPAPQSRLVPLDLRCINCICLPCDHTLPTVSVKGSIGRCTTWSTEVTVPCLSSCSPIETSGLHHGYDVAPRISSDTAWKPQRLVVIRLMGVGLVDRMGKPHSLQRR